MASDGLSVAVTGPTGDLGIATVSALERSRRVRKIVGMAPARSIPRARAGRRPSTGRATFATRRACATRSPARTW